MCRSIHALHNFAPPARADEIDAAALQYVRKVSGMTRPSRSNEEAFARAVQAVAAATNALLGELVASGAPHDRDVERERARARFERRRAVPTAPTAPAAPTAAG
jgi:hypothetical protein